ncbi:hypothetical protein ACCI51_16390 [Microbulbifer echini]|uniref:Uncharacterized protein n=1 Tax=Microbulbifer echini TaxID=1529067 RepID=A0ABV4NRI2_9GAMM
MFEQKFGLALFAIVAGIVAHTTSLIAFLMPLKVLLLASSDGVPSYSQVFIRPENKTEWIVGLSLVALLLYVISLIAELFADRIAANGGRLVQMRRGLAGVAVAQGDSRQEERIKGYYSTCCTILSNSIFTIVAIVAVTFINLPLAAYIIMMALTFYGLSYCAYQNYINGRGGNIGKLIDEDIGGYLKLVTSVTFLTGFLVILQPFLVGGDANLLFSIVSIILLRQLLSTFSTSSKSFFKFIRSKDKVDTLLFEAYSSRDDGQSLELSDLHQFLAADSRSSWISAELVDFGVSHECYLSLWVDSIVQDVFLINLVRRERLDAEPLYQVRIYDMKSRRVMNGEKLLLEYMGRKQLRLPPSIRSFERHSYHCEILDLQQSRLVRDNDEYDMVIHKAIELQWSLKPCDKLVAAYRNCAPTLITRLSRISINKLLVAVDTEETVKVFTCLKDLWGEILKILSSSPLYLHNHSWGVDNFLVHREFIEPFFSGWDRWSIEPIGYKFPKGIKKSEIRLILSKLSLERSDLESQFTVDSAILINKMAKFEAAFSKKKYRECLSIAENLIDSDVLLMERESA